MQRTEYPNPQFRRSDFVNLNGKWEFEIDNNFTGFKRDLLNNKLKQEIIVPFCPESELSLVNHKDFIYACWYKRKFNIDEEQMKKRITINFGAVDYLAVVYINGKRVGSHSGGSTPFKFSINDFVIIGENEVTVYVEDNTKDNIPSGKQSSKLNSYGCFYTRVTGIWQTVYLEFTPHIYIESIKYFPNITDGSVDIEVKTNGEANLLTEVYFNNKLVGQNETSVIRKLRYTIKLQEIHLWGLGEGNLYDVKFSLGEDTVHSYFGLREVKYDGLKFMLNGKSVFQRLVLDQGYYKDGVYTAKNVDEFKQDIQMALDLGFNGARLHQKVFEPQYLYYCDLMGFMVWGEFPSWGIRTSDLDVLGNFIQEWTEVVERDFNHPSILMWCPLNETWEDLDDSERVRDVRFVESIYSVTKTLDETRPCVDVSGGYHGRKTDLFDFHYYGDLEGLKDKIKDLEEKDLLTMGKTYAKGENIFYQKGQPVLASEYGGLSFNLKENNEKAWAYSNINNEDEFVKNFIDMAEVLLSSSKLSGFCYTQLYDVEQEVNGLYTYDRKLKFDKKHFAKIKSVLQQKAKIEK